MMMDESAAPARPLALASEIVSASVAHNPLPPADLPALIRSVHATLLGIVGGVAAAAPEAPRPAVPVRTSVTPDYIVRLEDGRRFKSLKRHLRTQYAMTPEAYRAKWDLPPDYPMVAPGYAKARSDLAEGQGLGQGPGQPRASAATAA